MQEPKEPLTWDLVCFLHSMYTYVTGLTFVDRAVKLLNDAHYSGDDEINIVALYYDKQIVKAIRLIIRCYYRGVA